MSVYYWKTKDYATPIGCLRFQVFDAVENHRIYNVSDYDIMYSAT
jgi:hypothetical protein